MLNIYPLYSSSSGNMYLIETKYSNVLLDIGVTYKKVKEALASLSKSIENIDAIFITHEHSDHIKGLVQFVKNNPNTPIYTSLGTAEYLKNFFKENNIRSFNLKDINFFNNNIDINDLSITSFPTSHDAIDPVGYKLSCEDKSITIATDLGVMTNTVFSHLENSNLLVIESNYDKNMLYAGKYPFEIKRRIDGPFGHLSNEDTSNVILKLAKNGSRNFLLGHMSENNNIPALARETINSSLVVAGYNLDEFNINIATKDFSNEVYKL